eukprot:3655264-Amphidinium_carterae.1
MEDRSHGLVMVSAGKELKLLRLELNKWEASQEAGLRNKSAKGARDPHKLEFRSCLTKYAVFCMSSESGNAANQDRLNLVSVLELSKYLEEEPD